MMREGRCCAGRGWWCAMAWIFFGGVMGFTHLQQIQSDCGKKMIPFHAI